MDEEIDKMDVIKKLDKKIDDRLEVMVVIMMVIMKSSLTPRCH